MGALRAGFLRGRLAGALRQLQEDVLQAGALDHELAQRLLLLRKGEEQAAGGGVDVLRAGLVQWAYQSVGVKLPRTAREQSVIGQRIMRVEDMRAGDIVAFRHPRRGYHTGIYVGDGKFVHSPRRRSSVKISSLSDPYFNTTFLGARRVSMSGASGEDLVAQAESRMEQYTEERMVRDMERSRASRQKATAESRKKSRDKAQSARQGKKKDSVSKPSEQRKKTCVR